MTMVPQLYTTKVNIQERFRYKDGHRKAELLILKVLSTCSSALSQGEYIKVHLVLVEASIHLF